MSGYRPWTVHAIALATRIAAQAEREQLPAAWRLFAMRRALRLKQRELAARAGLGRECVSSLERGSRPSQRTARALLRALGLPLRCKTLLFPPGSSGRAHIPLHVERAA